MRLDDVRAQIDALDREIAERLERRRALSAEAQRHKAPDASLFSSAREAEILAARPAWADILRRTRLDLLAGAPRPVPRVLGDGFAVIAGPCSIESAEHAHETAKALAATGVRRMRGGCWKPRTSPYDFQGHGEAALRWMRAACDEHGLELWTEVRDLGNLAHASMIDVAWVGARNAQNFELLQAVGQVCHRVVLKRGPAMTVEEWLHAAEYIRLGGAAVALCERGVRTFDPMLRNALDIPGALLARAMGRYEVIVDPSHATGVPSLVEPLVAAARAAGLDGAIIEAHRRPAESMTDAAQALSMAALQGLTARMFGA